MIPNFHDGYYLAPGAYECTVLEIEERYGFTQTRKDLIKELKELLSLAKRCGFMGAALGGGFSTAKDEPRDLDILWFPKSGTNKDNVPLPCCLKLWVDTGKHSFQCIPLEEPWRTNCQYWVNQYGFDTKTRKDHGMLLLSLADYDD